MVSGKNSTTKQRAKRQQPQNKAKGSQVGRLLNTIGNVKVTMRLPTHCAERAMLPQSPLCLLENNSVLNTVGRGPRDITNDIP